MTTTKPKATTFRLDPELRPEVEQLAKRTRRSMNASLNYLVEFALRKIAEENDQPTTRG